MMRTLVLAALLGYIFRNPAEAAECEKDWKYYNKYCYLFWDKQSSENGDWNGHQINCKNHGALLVSIHSTKEQYFIHNHMKPIIGRYGWYWIGMAGLGYDVKDLEWWDGTKVDFTQFSPHRPAHPWDFVCVRIPYACQWYADGSCHDVTNYSVCKKKGVDDCDGVTCQHGGRCVDLYEKYECNCSAGYTGKHCETDINDCDGVTCQHGGNCVDQVNFYECTCKPGYTGTHCETDIDECKGVICKNDGLCKDEVNGYRCDCANGYTGTHCEIDIDECADVTCTGDYVCKDGVNSYCCVPNLLLKKSSLKEGP